MTYRPDEAMELDTIVSTAARRNGCTKARALLDPVRGQAEVKVTFNLYAPTLDDGPVSFNGSYILDATTPRGIVPHRTSRWAATFAEVRERRQRRSKRPSQQAFQSAEEHM